MALFNTPKKGAGGAKETADELTQTLNAAREERAALQESLTQAQELKTALAGAFGIAGESAADDEAILRAGERDVEQAAMFAQGAGFSDGAKFCAEFDVVPEIGNSDPKPNPTAEPQASLI